MINKKEFIDMVSEHTGRTKKDIEEWTTLIFEEVKEAANYITDSNEEDGVAKAIEKFVLS